jgi:hypothetical protein
MLHDVTRAGAFVAAIAMVVAGLATPVTADPNRYKLVYERGKELSAAGDWEGARAAFLYAYNLEHRAINLFNVAQTYWHQHDLEHARTYYQRFLAEAATPASAQERDEKNITLATERLGEISLALVDAGPVETRHVEPAVDRDRYPREMIDRPATLPATMLEASAGMAVIPHYTAADGGHVDTHYEPASVVAAGFGVTDRVELRGEFDADLARSRGSLASAGVGVGLSNGIVIAGASARLTYAFDTPGLYDARLDVPVRIRLTRELAVISDDDLFVVTLDDFRHQVLFRLPVGIAYQFPEAVYAWVSTRPITADLRGSSVQALFADYLFVGFGVGYAPNRAFDVVLEGHASDLSVDGSLVARLRL